MKKLSNLEYSIACEKDCELAILTGNFFMKSQPMFTLHYYKYMSEENL